LCGMYTGQEIEYLAALFLIGYGKSFACTPALAVVRASTQRKLSDSANRGVNG
jgi:hypothetical protein